MRSQPAYPTVPWAAPTANRAERDFFSWALLAARVLLAALAWPFFAGRVYMGGELGDFHLPARAFYAQQLARGEPFDWMPDIFAGFYLTGEGQAGTYHPLHWLLYRFLPLRTALGWEYLSSYPILAVGMWSCCGGGSGGAMRPCSGAWPLRFPASTSCTSAIPTRWLPSRTFRGCWP